jgi:hypothetical protein
VFVQIVPPADHPVEALSLADKIDEICARYAGQPVTPQTMAQIASDLEGSLRNAEYRGEYRSDLVMAPSGRRIVNWFVGPMPNDLTAINLSPALELKWPHPPCDECVSLGGFDDTDDGRQYDLYFCRQDGLPTVIARYGADPGDYTSGLQGAGYIVPLAEAKWRAKVKRLI